MKGITLKKQIHEAVDLIDDADFLNAINTLLQQKSEEYVFELDENDKIELQRRRKAHLSGKSKSTTLAEIRKKALSDLKK